MDDRCWTFLKAIVIDLEEVKCVVFLWQGSVRLVFFLFRFPGCYKFHSLSTDRSCLGLQSASYGQMSTNSGVKLVSLVR